MKHESKYQQSIDEIKKLSVSEKLAIVEDLWDSILFAEDDCKISDKQKKELDERLKKHGEDPDNVKEWAHIKNTIKSQL